MIQAYQARQRRELSLLRAATIGTPESFGQVLEQAFPPLWSGPALPFQERWW